VPQPRRLPAQRLHAPRCAGAAHHADAAVALEAGELDLRQIFDALRAYLTHQLILGDHCAPHVPSQAAPIFDQGVAAGERSVGNGESATESIKRVVPEDDRRDQQHAIGDQPSSAIGCCAGDQQQIGHADRACDTLEHDPHQQKHASDT